MKILALELSAVERSVAALDAATGRVGVARESRAAHTQVFALIAQALANAGLVREEIDVLAVGIGPGSYTGIRMAISVAQGWQAARGIKLLGIGTLEMLAAQLFEQGQRGEVDLVTDAQRGEFYWARCAISSAGWAIIKPLQLVPAAEVVTLAAGGARVMGPDSSRHFKGAADLWPDAGALARLAVQRTDFVAPEALQPIYLRAAEFAKAPPPRVIPGL